MSLPERFEGRIGRLSLVVPMFNEAEHVGALVADIARQDFEGELELLVADGASTDGSGDILRQAAREAALPLTVVENPHRWVSHGLNECIRRAGGDLIVRLDCHSRYPPDYLSRIVRGAERSGAASIGGLVEATGRTPGERAVACAMASPFGGVHWTRHATRGEPVDVDTVYVGAFRAEVFGRVGLFDEELVRNQDDELSLRIRRAGGRIVLDPTIRATYTPRGSYRAVWRQYFEYGLWKIPVMSKHRQVVSGRSLAPLAFVGSLALLGGAAPLSRRARALLAAEVAGYSLAALGFAVAATRRRSEPIALAPRVALVFPTFHVAYGVGLARGVVRLGRRRKPRR